MTRSRLPILVVNNYTRTGIGDFGQDLIRELTRQGISTTVVETSPRGAGYIGQGWSILSWPGTVVANIGLTSWGRSPVRNVLGFVSLGVRAALGRRTFVLLHNAIEVISQADAGYPISPTTLRGAHWAVSLLRRASIVVFSKMLADHLEADYGIHPLRYTPIPCRDDVPRVADLSPSRTVVHLGYLARYKGVELLRELAGLLPEGSQLLLVGGRHRVLSSEGGFTELLDDLERELVRKGARIVGFVPEPEIWEMLQRCAIGVLPYSSSSGASASFATLASAGLPVVATDLPEFGVLESAGAGVELVPASAAAVAGGISRILGDPVLWQRLRGSQVAFAHAHSWKLFGEWLRIQLES